MAGSPASTCQPSVIGASPVIVWLVPVIHGEILAMLALVATFALGVALGAWLGARH